MLAPLLFMAATGSAIPFPSANTEAVLKTLQPIPEVPTSEYWICPRTPSMVSFSLRIEHGRVFWTSPLHLSFVGPEGDTGVRDLELKVISNTTLGLVIMEPFNDARAGYRHIGGTMIALDRLTGEVVESQAQVGSKFNFVTDGKCTLSIDLDNWPQRDHH
jgi:hypothetical protein